VDNAQLDSIQNEDENEIEDENEGKDRALNIVQSLVHCPHEDTARGPGNDLAERDAISSGAAPSLYL